MMLENPAKRSTETTPIGRQTRRIARPCSGKSRHHRKHQADQNVHARAGEAKLVGAEEAIIADIARNPAINDASDTSLPAEVVLR